jgi:hypothetical protein
MNISTLSIPLTTTPEQVGKLVALQNAFALVCNALAPVVRDTRCWSRVALHHMMYRSLREQFPQIGSQMVCNAIYSVSRTSRLIFQAEQSPFNIERYSDKTLPLLQFLPTAPVYFDRHTLSLKPGSLSMYTLDGRMRFEVNLSAEDLARFKTLKLSEVVLNLTDEVFTLNFSFADDLAQLEEETQGQGEGAASFLPEYVLVEEANKAQLSSAPTPSAPPTPSTPPALPAFPPSVHPQAFTAGIQLMLNPLGSARAGAHAAAVGGAAQPFMTQVVPPVPTDMKLKTMVMQHVSAQAGLNVTVTQEAAQAQVNTLKGASS